MTITDVLLSVFEIAAIVPIGLLCLIVFDRDSVFPRPASLLIYTGIFTALCAVGGYLRVAVGLNINAVILSIFALMILYLIFTVNASKVKILYIITSCGAVSSSIRLYSYLLEAHLYSHHTFQDTHHWGLLLKWFIIVVLLIAFTLIADKVRWLMYESNLDNMWKVLWLVPVIVDVANMIAIPHDYEIMKQGRIWQIYITVVTTLVIMQVVFHLMLYHIAKNLTEKAKATEEARFLSMQASQYQSLQRHIEVTAKLRHDFKHTVRTASTLANEGKFETLKKLLADYNTAAASAERPRLFTRHSSLNALVSYYYEQASSKNITCDWVIRVPEKIDIEDIDLCSVVGNILENAIHAAETAENENRYINFKADMEDNGDIYIVSTNGFSGMVHKDSDKYLSTKKDGSGIGIESVKNVAKRYRGFVKFYHDQNTFYADVMLRQNQI